MKKKLALLTVILILSLCLASCELIHTALKVGEHSYEYIVSESGHHKVYNCGCPTPDIIEEHYDHDGDWKCDACGYVFSIIDLNSVAPIVLDYEQACKDEIDKLNTEHPEYIYYYHPVDKVCCYFVLDGEASADAIIEKYDMKNLFSDAKVSSLNAIKMIGLIFDRNDFTEGIHRKIKQISEDEAFVENLYVDMERAYYQSYMPKIEYYTDCETVLKYEHAPYAVRTYNSEDIIIRTKAEYDAYLDELIEYWEVSDDSMARYEIEIINAAKDKYDEAFFDENALILTRMVVRGSGSIKLTVNGLYISENKVYVVIKTDIPVMGTADMQYAFLAFVVDKDDVVNVNEVITLE